MSLRTTITPDGHADRGGGVERGEFRAEIEVSESPGGAFAIGDARNWAESGRQPVEQSRAAVTRKG